MAHVINHDHFERARTPEKLKEIFVERIKYSYVFNDLRRMLANISKIHCDEFVDIEFWESCDNSEVFHRLECYGNEAIQAGLELICLVELWRGRHELGDGAMLVEQHESPRVGIMSFNESEITVHYDDIADTQAIGCRNPTKLAHNILRTLTFEPFRLKVLKDKLAQQDTLQT